MSAIAINSAKYIAEVAEPYKKHTIIIPPFILSMLYTLVTYESIFLNCPAAIVVSILLAIIHSLLMGELLFAIDTQNIPMRFGVFIVAIFILNNVGIGTSHECVRDLFIVCIAEFIVLAPIVLAAIYYGLLKKKCDNKIQYESMA